ncbi:MAG: hypothetical protein ACXQT4_04580 [Methanotrichaceae archaeon]
MALAKVNEEGPRLHASDSYGEFREVFIAEVLEAERECEMGRCKRFDNIDDALAFLDE